MWQALISPSVCFITNISIGKRHCTAQGKPFLSYVSAATFKWSQGSEWTLTHGFSTEKPTEKVLQTQKVSGKKLPHSINAPVLFINLLICQLPLQQHLKPQQRPDFRQSCTSKNAWSKMKSFSACLHSVLSQIHGLGAQPHKVITTTL